MKVRVKRSGTFLRDLSARASSPQELLARMGGYLRAGAKARIERGEGLAPWADSTRKKYEQQGTSKVTAHGQIRASYARKLDQYLGRKNNTEAAGELRRLLSGARVDGSNHKVIATLQRRLDRVQRARAAGRAVNIGKRRIEKHRLLGRLADAFGMYLHGKSVTVLNKVSWSAVHNEGGTVGNNSVLPERRFLEITDKARQRFADMALDFLLGRS